MNDIIITQQKRFENNALGKWLFLSDKEMFRTAAISVLCNNDDIFCREIGIINFDKQRKLIIDYNDRCSRKDDKLDDVKIRKLSNNFDSVLKIRKKNNQNHNQLNDSDYNILQAEFYETLRDIKDKNDFDDLWNNYLKTIKIIRNLESILYQEPNLIFANSAYPIIKKGEPVLKPNLLHSKFDKKSFSLEKEKIIEEICK